MCSSCVNEEMRQHPHTLRSCHQCWCDNVIGVDTVKVSMAVILTVVIVKIQYTVYGAKIASFLFSVTKTMSNCILFDNFWHADNVICIKMPTKLPTCPDGCFHPTLFVTTAMWLQSHDKLIDSYNLWNNTS